MPIKNKAKPLVLITHYHLRRGGVTRVIQQQAEVLQASGNYDVVICTGLKPEVKLNCPVVVCEKFQYSDDTELDGNKLNHHDILKKISGLCGREPDLLHAHNHSLGKSGYYLHFVNWWVNEGKKALFQLHDFAEDGRPRNHKLNSAILENHPDLSLYPTGEHIRYALLNNRDLEFLEQGGFDSDKTAVLPNAVTVEDLDQFKHQLPEPFEPQSYITYPTRAIRRKNVGELILFASVFPEEQFHITLSPQNPKEQKYFNTWVEFVEDEKMSNVVFDAGKKLEGPFFSYLYHAKQILTTSIAEGFGLAFLEPWSAGNSIAGRDLNGITNDFKTSGLKLDDLYQHILISEGYIDKNCLFERWEKAAVQLIRSYYTNKTEEEISAQIESVEASLKEYEEYDFGWLDEEAQREVIQKARHDEDLKSHIRSHLNISSEKPWSRIEQNRSVLKSSYNIDQYAEKIEQQYDQLMNAKSDGTTGFVPVENVLRQFMNLEHLSMLRL